jgi:glycosyltransferase involved in cell wall biosynthesis
MLGCQIKESTHHPLIITEHGIYWREVEAGATELECGFQLASMEQDSFNLQPLRHHWTITFQEMARQAYRQANAITTVCRANAQLQIKLDAPAKKCRVIPNSVNVKQLAPAVPRQPAPDGCYQIGFVGRVVSIKDVLTFIKACRLVSAKLPQAQFYIIGPLDHDPEYVARCRQVVSKLGLAQKISFTGEVDTSDWYHHLDVVVLTSISEGQPLVLLEAMAAGTPIVTSDVGGCAELVLGSNTEDRALGASGLLTPVGKPKATASAILELCQNAGRWQQASQAGRSRVRHFYSSQSLCQAYQNLYNQWL